VGKTVMAFQAIDALLTEGISPYNILYISLETPLYTGMALEKIVNMFQECLVALTYKMRKNKHA
jgi:hypothetical protein